jgi:N-acetylneuraminate synthase
VIETKRAWQALGQVQFGATEREKKSMIFRRSLYVAQDMKAGDQLTPDNLRSVRPGFGLPPKYYDVLLGRRINCDVKRGTPMRWELLG